MKITDKQFDMYKERMAIEKKQGWREEINSIPFIQFKETWKVKAIPPFGDTIVRFLVVLPSGVEKSVFLDGRNSLGYWPDGYYWEVYPYRDGTGRCNMEDIDQLLEMIEDETT
jgi:hypothetical protein